MAMHGFADVDDAFLKHAVGRWISYHKGGELQCVRGCFALEVAYVDITVLIAADDYDAHSGHHSTRWICTVC